MSINKKILVASFIAVLLGASSCKKYLNVNTNPNYAQVATVKTLLPAAELYVGTGLGVDLQVAGNFYAQFWTQSPGASQFHNFDQYAPGQDASSYGWTNLYNAEENLYQLYKLADSQKNTQYMAIALLMQAYTFQLITDGWGDAPCKEALKGQYTDGHLVNPHYDPQDSIYTTILALIDSANKLINPNAPILPGTDDLIYGAAAATNQVNIMTYWQNFSNTLALKVYLRMSQVAPGTAAAGIAALYANPITSTFIGSAAGDSACIAYGFNSANNNPLYADELGLTGTRNFVGSASCLDTMSVENDPRLWVFYQPISGANFVGLQQGLYNGIPYTGYSYPTAYVAGDGQNSASGKAPVNLITNYESFFLQAEAVARGWAPATVSDMSLFYNGIQASFNYYSAGLNATYVAYYGGTATSTVDSDYLTQATGSMANAPLWAQYPAAGTVQQKVQYIITQKWFAMCGNQGFEAWSEWRRTGYPSWFTYSVSTIIGNTFPKRLLYPTSESTVNSNYPGLAPLTSRVWWDVTAATDH